MPTSQCAGYQARAKLGMVLMSTTAKVPQENPVVLVDRRRSHMEVSTNLSCLPRMVPYVKKTDKLSRRLRPTCQNVQVRFERDTLKPCF